MHAGWHRQLLAVIASSFTHPIHSPEPAELHASKLALLVNVLNKLLKKRGTIISLLLGNLNAHRHTVLGVIHYTTSN
jgi:hypothetical protein